MDEKLPEWLEQCLTEDDRQLIGIVGTEAFLRLIDTYGGGNVYIPKNDRFERYARNKAIVAEFDGYNFRELAQKYHLTEMQIRVIVKDKAAAESGSTRWQVSAEDNIMIILSLILRLSNTLIVFWESLVSGKNCVMFSSNLTCRAKNPINRTQLMSDK